MRKRSCSVYFLKRPTAVATGTVGATKSATGWVAAWAAPCAYSRSIGEEEIWESKLIVLCWSLVFGSLEDLEAEHHRAEQHELAIDAGFFGNADDLHGAVRGDAFDDFARVGGDGRVGGHQLVTHRAGAFEVGAHLAGGIEREGGGVFAGGRAVAIGADVGDHVGLGGRQREVGRAGIVDGFEQTGIARGDGGGGEIGLGRKNDFAELGVGLKEFGHIRLWFGCSQAATSVWLGAAICSLWAICQALACE